LLHIQNRPVQFNTTINGASFIARNTNSRNNRERVVQKLKEHGIRIESPPDRDSTSGDWFKSKIPMMTPYKFHLAFENGNVVDYVTEKVYLALAAGVVPIYFGAPNIREFVPYSNAYPSPIIDVVTDFDNNITALAEHLKQCMNNETLYNSYHQWRYHPLPDWFMNKFNFTTLSTECRTCRYMHAKLNGYGWDVTSQRAKGYVYGPVLDPNDDNNSDNYAEEEENDNEEEEEVSTDFPTEGSKEEEEEEEEEVATPDVSTEESSSSDDTDADAEEYLYDDD